MNNSHSSARDVTNMDTLRRAAKRTSKKKNKATRRKNGKQQKSPLGETNLFQIKNPQNQGKKPEKEMGKRTKKQKIGSHP